MRALAAITLAAVLVITVTVAALPRSTPSLDLPQREVAAAAEPARVELTAVDGDVGRAQQLVVDLGGRVEVVSGGRVQALVPASAVRALEAAHDIVRVERPGMFVPLQVVPATDLIGADRWVEAGFTGHGTKVAILDAGFLGYESQLGTLLPRSVTTRSFRSDANVSGGTEHGRRAAQVVHSVAPGAQLYLVNFATVTELSAAVDYLIAEDLGIVSFSLGYIHNGPGDGTGPVNEVVSRGVEAGQVWAVASGNWAQQHWEGPFRDSDGDTVHEFAGGAEMNEHQFLAGDLITASVRWDEPWGAACADYDIEIFGPSGALVRASRAVQDCDDDPVESLQVLATQTGAYGLRIIEATPSEGPRRLDVMMVGTPDRGNTLSISTAASSLSEPADHPGVVTVGALTIAATRTEAAYSSRGPTTDGRFKPDLLAPTGAGNATSGTNFGGTSAAAPHVAGVLALLSEAFPEADADRLRSLLQTRAMGVTATPGGSGARRVDLGSLFGVGPLIPAGGADARFVGEFPEGRGVAFVEYDGPDGYPPRFLHLLVVIAVFRRDESGKWRSYRPVAPEFVNRGFGPFIDGDALVVLLDEP